MGAQAGTMRPAVMPQRIAPVPRARERSRARAQPQAESATDARSRKLPLPITLFLLSQLVPWIITIGPIRMSAYRFVLIAWLIPCLIMWLSGKVGRIRIADLALLAYCFWCFLAIIAVHGFSYSLEPGGIIFIETMGAYMIARCYIRDADDFYNTVLLLFRIVAVLLPFAMLESITGRNFAREILAMIYPTFPDAMLDPRWGLRRAHVIFEHPILFGVCAASIFALTHLVLGYKESFFRRWTRNAVVIGAAFFSLSSGPLSALGAQGMLIGWNWAAGSIKERWKILLGFSFIAGLSAELLSNRSLPAIFISYFAFNESSARVRLQIWDHGMASAMKHPLFGVGFNEWERASWMTTSIDMFWIIDAVRHGVPAELFMVIGFFAAVLTVAFKKGLDERAGVYRTAYLIAMTGFFMSGWTVYFWNATYVLFLFVLGSGMWIADIGGQHSGHHAASLAARRSDAHGDRRNSVRGTPAREVENRAGIERARVGTEP